MTLEGDRLVLHTWDLATGRLCPEHVLNERMPPFGYFTLRLSPDPEHLHVIRTNDQPEEGKRVGEVNRWLVFSVTSGKKVADRPIEAAAEPALLMGQLLVSGREGFLTAVDATTGQTRWRRPIEPGPGPVPYQ